MTDRHGSPGDDERVSEPVLDWLDEIAAAEGLSREDAIEYLISSYWRLEEIVENLEAGAPGDDREVGDGLGHFFGAIAVEGFMDRSRFEARVDDWIRTLRGAEPAEGTDGPLVPGDPECHTTQRRRKEGIPLADHVRNDLIELGRGMNVEL
jgi:hypothetical protein